MSNCIKTTRTADEMQADYLKYRGQCKPLCDQAIKDDPTLTLVRGYYFCPIWNVREQHWWTKRTDGSIYDPSALQYPSAGAGFYEEFNGCLECDNCGKTIKESEARFDSRFAFCSYECHGRFVGVL